MLVTLYTVYVIICCTLLYLVYVGQNSGDSAVVHLENTQAFFVCKNKQNLAINISNNVTALTSNAR